MKINICLETDKEIDVNLYEGLDFKASEDDEVDIVINLDELIKGDPVKDFEYSKNMISNLVTRVYNAVFYKSLSNKEEVKQNE